MIGAHALERRKIELSVDARSQRAELERMTDVELFDLIAEGQGLVPRT
jgi:hypothetical protein